ncbi:MAG: copper-binding protein [Crenarchaeota archaeon]|nr:MAG: copper-binding protein [Thermoproteota archaeon]RDJ32869.1 MAG: copper-binding protein [Thermoproteota archaeon]RDJ38297.1 MAG: copper-binding protein [Thermoproteota archaeon]
MATIDKAAIAWTIAIVAFGAGIAAVGDDLQSSTSEVKAPTAATVTPPKAEMKEEPTKAMMAGYERLTSQQDPGVGHESHQLAIILAPSDKVYSGTLKYDASEPIQLVTLHGPLSPGEDKGQAIWTPDGETKFALTFVDEKKSKGEWKFSGNALAVHTMKTTPFIVDYKVDVTEKAMSESVKTGTMGSMQDPGVGHESHQLAIILPPSENTYSGILSYSASEPIQLVSLKGPLAEGMTAEKTWTPDGETIFELTFVDPKNAMGSWEFSGNALAVHTLNTNEFTVSYSVSATSTAPEKVTVTTPKVEETPKAMGPKTVNVSMPQGSGIPGCEETNECYIPASVSINVGDTVHWTNDDAAAHTVTSGSPSAGGPDGKFDSSLMSPGATFDVTFDEKGSVDYFCIVHPWMVGNVNVN